VNNEFISVRETLPLFSAPSQIRSQSMNQRILIAEDDEVQGAVLLAAMQHCGYTVDIVDDGLEAVRSLQTGHYDLALLDYNIPHVDGRAVAQLLQNLPEGVRRPRLIAVTAAAERLNDFEVANGSPSFDAIVSKTAGLPALVEVVRQNLMAAAELDFSLLQARDRDRNCRAEALRKRRRRAPLFALPGFGMAGCFAAALWWAGTSLNGITSSIDSAHSTVALSMDAQNLVGAVADTQASQRNYLVTGLAEDHAVFDEHQKRVDRLLSAALPLSPSGSPGFAEGGSPTFAIQPLLRVLSEEAESRSARSSQVSGGLMSLQSGRATAQRLQEWANSLVADSQEMVVTSLGLIGRNLKFVMVILIAGFFYGLWNAGAATWRQLQASGPWVRLVAVGLPMPPAPMTISGVAEVVEA
jgi:CheY-like chemotaxis protein